MNRYKKFYIFIILMFTAMGLYGGPIDSTITATAANDFRVFDLPLISGIGYFIKTISTFGYVAGYLATVLGIVGVAWNAFRLIFGTQQVRKACVDIGAKFLLFTVIVNLYGSIISGTMTLATDLGLYAGGGYYETRQTMETMFLDLTEKSRAADEALEAYYNAMGESGKKISDTTIRMIAKNTGATPDEIREKMEKFKAQESRYGDLNLENIGKGAVSAGGITGGAIAGAAIGSLVPGVGTVIGGIVGGLIGGIGGWFLGGWVGEKADNAISEHNMYKNVQDAQYKKILQDINDGDYKQAFLLLKALNDVITPTIAEDGTISYIYDPRIYLKGANGSGIEILSPGAIIKTGVLWANIIKTMEASEYDSDAGNFLERSLDGTFNSLTRWLMQIILVIGIIASMIFATIQYCMAVFEYFIVTSMGVLFIPCVLWDGTKTYASKLIVLFLSFFVKITVTILCLFFVVNIFSKGASVIVTSGDPTSLANFAYLFFIIIMGFVLTQNAPQIAMTMLNGTPQLSMGEFLHAAATVGAGAALAKQAATTVGNKVGTPLGHVAQGANAGISEGIAAFSGSRAGGATVRESLRQGVSQTASAWRSGIVNQTSRLITGRDSAKAVNASSLHSGVGSVNSEEFENKINKNFANANGTINNQSINEYYRFQAEKNAQQNAGSGNQKTVPEPEKLSEPRGQEKSDLEQI